MARVKVKFPNQTPLIVCSIPVRITDINYGNHLGNDRLLSIIHEARMKLLAMWSYSELDAGGNSLIMADVMIAYRGEAFYGDVLEVRIYAEEFTAVSFDLLYHINTQRNGESIDIAHAKTGMVCFDYEQRKVAEIKEPLKNRLQGMEI